MKQSLFFFIFAFAALISAAQNHPVEWKKYINDNYYYDIESASDRQTALDLARSNLARQIQVKVNEVSEMEKYAVNGKSSVLYSSTKSFSTSVDMSLAETKSHYSDENGKYYVIVFINKEDASAFYENEVKMLVSNTDKVIGIAENYISGGFKSKAKKELEDAVLLFDDAGKSFFWLNVFGLDKSRIEYYLRQVNTNEQKIKQKLSELEYGTTYCVVCDADLFGSRFVKLGNEVKGALSASGCNFVDDAVKADYVIRIKASARKYNEFQGAYFSYIDAMVSIEKNATSQRIFEDEISIKGSHTLSYNEAARDGYKRIAKEVAKMLKENIKN